MTHFWVSGGGQRHCLSCGLAQSRVLVPSISTNRLRKDFWDWPDHGEELCRGGTRFAADMAHASERVFAR